MQGHNINQGAAVRKRELAIRGESDVVDLLQEILKGDWPDDVVPEFNFQNWPVISIDLKGKNFNSSITPAMMEAFLELQRNINRTFALALHQNPSGQCLSKAERQAFELVVKVSPGSSLFDIDLQEILKNFATQAAGKLEGKHIVTIVGIIAAAYAGPTMFKNYLDEESARQQSGQIVAMSKEETKRLEVISGMLKKQPELKTIAELAQDSQHAILKGAAEAKTAEVMGTKITGEEAAELTKQKREKSVNKRLEGEYRILAVDTTDPKNVKVKLRNRAGDFTALFADDSLNAKEVAILKDKLISREWVTLLVDVVFIRDKVHSAEILRIGKGK